jgi:hypothetical protein
MPQKNLAGLGQLGLIRVKLEVALPLFMIDRATEYLAIVRVHYQCCS